MIDHWWSILSDHFDVWVHQLVYKDPQDYYYYYYYHRPKIMSTLWRSGILNVVLLLCFSILVTKVRIELIKTSHHYLSCCIIMFLELVLEVKQLIIHSSLISISYSCENISFTLRLGECDESLWRQSSSSVFWEDRCLCEWSLSTAVRSTTV